MNLTQAQAKTMEGHLRDQGNTIYGRPPEGVFELKVLRPITTDEREAVEVTVDFPLKAHTKKGRFHIFIADPKQAAPFTEAMGDATTAYFKAQIVNGKVEVLRYLKGRNW